MSDNIFEDLADMVNDTMSEFGAATVVYTRGGESLSVAATVGRTVFRQDSDMGSVRIETRDYIISAALLILGGGQTVPQRGDRITQTVDGTARTYEVLAPGGEPPWRWSDPHHRRVRIHTKEITRANV